MRFALALIVSLLFAREALAVCECRCVSGSMQPLCSSSLDIQPPCVGICPIVPPSIPPIETPRIPPIGTTRCRNEQVLNPNTRQYEWREVCQ